MTGFGLRASGFGPIGCLVAAMLTTACHRGPAVDEPSAPPAIGVSVSLFVSADPARAYALVDDRRAIAVAADRTIAIADLPPDLGLGALAIEPLREHFAIGACHRDLSASPVVTCATTGAAPGRHAIRLTYATTTRYAARALTTIAMTAPDRATVTTTYAFPTAASPAAADVAIFDADAPTSPPPLVARGAIDQAGATAIVASAPRTLPAHLRRIYDGARRDRARPATPDDAWALASQPAVWVWLELGDDRTPAALPGAPVAARILDDGEPHDLAIPAGRAIAGAHATRLPLYVDADLHGARTRRAITTRSPRAGEPQRPSDRLALSVANTGTVAREVWFEEPLRPLPAPQVVRADPTARVVVGAHTARAVQIVAPASIVRVGFTLEYSGLTPD